MKAKAPKKERPKAVSYGQEKGLQKIHAYQKSGRAAYARILAQQTKDSK